MKTVQNLGQNIIAAITLSVVSLSLGAAFGIMSGRGALIGMISASIIAFITSLLGGTRVQCSGPTAPMTVLSSALIMGAHSESFGAMSADQFINFVLLLSAIAVFIMGILKLGRFIGKIPNVVISGFMSGIGLIIILDQLQKFVTFGETRTIETLLIYIGLTILTVGICIITPKLTKKYCPKFSGLLSGTLLAMIIVTTLTEMLNLDVSRIDLGEGIGGKLTHFFDMELPMIGMISNEILRKAVPIAMQLAVAIYLDSLLTSVIVDRMTGEPSKRNQELMAQGIGTAFMSFIGGIPGSQATVRSVLLIKEGATMRLSGILVGAFCFLGIFFFQDVIQIIPQAVFIGILIKVALDILDMKPWRLYVKELFSDHVLTNFLSRHDDEKIFVTNREIIIILGTILVTIFVNLVTSVIVFTILYHVCNQWIWNKNKIRDLKPILETETIIGED